MLEIYPPDTLSPQTNSPLSYLALFWAHPVQASDDAVSVTAWSRPIIVVLLVTERSLLPVRRSGTVCHTTLLTVCHWHHSAGSWELFCFLYHFHDYIFLFSGPWGFYLGQFKNFLRMYVLLTPLLRLSLQHLAYRLSVRESSQKSWTKRSRETLQFYLPLTRLSANWLSLVIVCLKMPTHNFKPKSFDMSKVNRTRTT